MNPRRPSVRKKPTHTGEPPTKPAEPDRRLETFYHVAIGCFVAHLELKLGYEVHKHGTVTGTRPCSFQQRRTLTALQGPLASSFCSDLTSSSRQSRMTVFRDLHTPQSGPCVYAFCPVVLADHEVDACRYLS